MRIAFLLITAVFILTACAIEEEPTFIAGGWCDYDGTTVCDDEGFTILYCNADLIWEPIDDCPNGCTMDGGYAECIGGTPDNAVDKDNQLPDTADNDMSDGSDGSDPSDDTVAEVDEMDDVDIVDTTADTDTVTGDDPTDQSDVSDVPDDTLADVDEMDDTDLVDTTVDEDTVADDAAEVDDAAVTDDDTVTDDTADDATVSDDDTTADCGADWTLNDTTGTCYRYFAAAKSFDEAETACVTESGHLVSIASVDENDWVRDTLGIPADTAYWLGYTAKDATGPGTGSANGKSCSSAQVVNSSGGTYSLATSSASTLSTGCLCGSSTVSGKFVSFRLNNPTTGYWEIVADTSADAVITIHEDPACSSCTADRVACVDNLSAAGQEVFNNQYQLNSANDYVIMITGKSSNVTGTLYIRPPVTASNFADHYSWTDGSTDLYSNFATGQPDYGNGNERCAHVRTDTPWGEWNDNQCSTALPYVCEKNP